MDIGKPIRRIRVEPVRDPFEAPAPAPERRTVPRKEPATPSRQPVKKPEPVKT